jgi:transposase
MGDAIYVGVDVAKRSLEVGVRPRGEVFTESNDQDGCARLAQRLAQLGPALVVLEASGGYERTLTAELGGARVAVVVVNPRQTRDFARALGRLEKTDQVDALMLAEFAERIRPQVHELPDEQARALAAVMVRRRQLVEMLVAEQNRLGQAPQALQHDLRSHIDFLRKQLQQLDQNLDQLLRQSPLWCEQENLLRGVPGIGAVTCATLLADLPELGRLSRREIAKLAGVARWRATAGRCAAGAQCGAAAPKFAPCSTWQRSVRSVQPGAQSLSWPPARRRQTEQAGAGRLHAQAADHSQRHAQTAHTLESAMSKPRVTHRGVAHKSTGGMLPTLPEPVDPVGNARAGLTPNTVARARIARLRGAVGRRGEDKWKRI